MMKLVLLLCCLSCSAAWHTRDRAAVVGQLLAQTNTTNPKKDEKFGLTAAISRRVGGVATHDSTDFDPHQNILYVVANTLEGAVLYRFPTAQGNVLSETHSIALPISTGRRTVVGADGTIFITGHSSHYLASPAVIAKVPALHFDFPEQYPIATAELPYPYQLRDVQALAFAATGVDEGMFEKGESVRIRSTSFPPAAAVGGGGGVLEGSVVVRSSCVVAGEQGVVVQWLVYVLTPGDLLLQVWRSEGSGGRLLGFQKHVTVVAGYNRIVLEESEVVFVNPGDCAGYSFNIPEGATVAADPNNRTKIRHEIVNRTLSVDDNTTTTVLDSGFDISFRVVVEKHKIVGGPLPVTPPSPPPIDVFSCEGLKLNGLLFEEGVYEISVTNHLADVWCDAEGWTRVVNIPADAASKDLISTELVPEEQEETSSDKIYKLADNDINSVGKSRVFKYVCGSHVTLVTRADGWTSKLSMSGWQIDRNFDRTFDCTADRQNYIFSDYLGTPLHNGTFCEDSIHTAFGEADSSNLGCFANGRWGNHGQVWAKEYDEYYSRTTILAGSVFSSNGTVRGWFGAVCKPLQGHVSFQVWRQNETKWELVGENTFDFGEVVGDQWIQVPLADQISVLEGDVVGFREYPPGLMCSQQFQNNDELLASGPGAKSVIVGLQKTDRSGKIILDNSESETKRTIHGVRALTRFPSEGPGVVIVGSYTYPSRIATIDAATMNLTNANTLNSPNHQFLRQGFHDTTTHRTFFICDSTPAAVVRVRPTDLVVVDELLLTGAERMSSFHFVSSRRRLFVLTGRMMMSIDIDKMTIDSTSDLQAIRGWGLRLSPLNVAYIVTQNSAVVRLDTGWFSNNAATPLDTLPLRLASGSRMDIVLSVFPLPDALDTLSNTTKAPIMTVSSVSGQTVIGKYWVSSRPTFDKLSPAIGHVTGNTSVVVSATGADGTSRIVYVTNPGSRDMMQGVSEGSVRIRQGETNALSGVLEIRLNQTWLVVSSGMIDDRLAAVGCRAAGYLNGANSGTCGATCALLPCVTLQCEGGESRLAECQALLNPNNCSSRNGVVVSCEAPTTNQTRTFPTKWNGSRLSVTTPSSLSAGPVKLQLVNSVSLTAHQSRDFTFYDAVLDSLEPNNVPEGSESVVVTAIGTGIACDAAATVRVINQSISTTELFENATDTTPVVLPSVLVDCNQTQISVRTTVAGISHFISPMLQLSLEGQYWLNLTTPLTLTRVVAERVSPSFGPTTGGYTVTVQAKNLNVPQLTETTDFSVTVGLFQTPTGAIPTHVVSAELLENSTVVEFSAPSVEVAGGKFLGISFNSQNYAISSMPFRYYSCSFENIRPTVVPVAGGKLRVTGSGFLNTGEIKMKVVATTGSEIATVRGNFLGANAISFPFPRTDIPAVVNVLVALDGRNFQETGMTVDIVDPQLTQVSPPCFHMKHHSDLSFSGTGFPVVEDSNCFVAFSVGRDKPVSAKCSVVSGTSIVVPESPTVLHSGAVSIQLSFDGGERFIQTTTTTPTQAYNLIANNLSPSIVQQGKPKVIQVWGKGFVDGGVGAVVRLFPEPPGFVDFGEEIGTSWTLVRRLGSGSQNWFFSEDMLEGSSVYGGQPTKNLDQSFSVAFNETDFDEFLFVTGNRKKWAIVGREEIQKTTAIITKSSESSTPHQVTWESMEGSIVVSLTDSTIANPRPQSVIYKEGSIPLAINSPPRANDGLEVYIRSRGAIAPLTYEGPESSRFELPTEGLVDGRFGVCVILAAGQTCTKVNKQLEILPAN